MKNKILSLVLALLMTASSASAVLADDVVAIAEEPEVVEAVEETVAGEYDKAIEFLANYGIFKGYSADNTGAEDDIQRYQMALFVSRIATGWVDDEQWEDGPENWSEFTDIDVDPVNKYYGALSFANQKGIIQGYGNGKFGPTDGIVYQDALTMVVRTLGYTGLDWPWGYIQKAVELGLTDGISGVAYSDDLTRGEVAQIIYNALFAQTKDGSNLGLKNFGIEFGWEKVVITASDLNTFVADKKEATNKVESNGLYTYYADSNKTADGYVAFKLLNDDGSLGDDTYYVLGSELGLSGADHAHDDDLVVGEPYYVLFEKDANSDLVKVVAYESLYMGTVENAGKTDDDGDAQDYAIQEFLKDNVLVDKYTGKSYINVTASGKNEVLVYAATGAITEEYVDGNLIAIDWETGDILAPVVDEDGEIVVDDDDNTVYEVEWYYNDLLGNYYRYKLNAAKEQIVGIDYMTEEEFLKTYEDLEVVKTRKLAGFNTPITSIAKTAYAALDLYDTNLDGVADRGIYESYRLAKFENSTVWCGSCGKNLSAYSFSTVKNYSKAVAAAKSEGEDISAGTVTLVAENVSACTHNNSVRGWFVDGYTPVEAYDEDGEFTGYENGYVIYGVDTETGAIKVVKNINDGTDEDSYVKTGVLRAYNLKNGTVTIGETKFDVADYDELAGNSFRYVTKNYTTRSCYTAYLRDLFNQFVEYVVVDGELVTVRAKSASTDKLFVVDSYAGMSSDGYIVVNGYFTSDLEYTQIKVATFNNWEGGDYFYYLDEDKAAESFTKGAMYAVSSYDKDEDAYYVQLAGAFDKNGNYEVDTTYVSLNSVKITEDEDGYATYTIDGTKERKMKSSDKYVIVLADTEERPYAPVIVYTGKLGDGWTVEGDIINTTDEDKGTYVIVNATVKGFEDTYKTGFVLLLDDTYYSVDYNGSSSEDWYLLGASTYEVEAFDLLNGDNDAVYTATNKSLKVGHVYFVQDGVIVEDEGIQTLAEIMPIMEEAYGEDSIDTGKYWFAKATINETNYKELFTGDKDADEKFIFANTDFADFAGVSKFYDDIIDGISIFAVEYNTKNETITKVSGVDAKAFAKKATADEFDYNVYFVYSVESADIVAYIDMVPASTVETVEGKTSTAITVWEDATYDAEIEAVVDYTEKYVDGKLAGITVNGVTLTFAGDAVENFDHANIDALGFHFGQKGACDLEAILAYVKVQDQDDYTMLDLEVVGSSLVETTYKNHDDEAKCNLVKSIYVPIVAENGENFISADVTFSPDVVVSFGLTAELDNAGWYDLEESVDFEIGFDNGKVVFAD